MAIAYLLDQGLTHREIAAHLGRNQSTISREIARGMTEHGYDALVAQKRAVDRLARPKPRKLDTNPQLRAFVIEELNTKWSPSPWLLSPAPLGTKLGALQSTSVTSSTSLLLCGAVIDKLAGDIHLIRGDFTTVSFLIGIICYSG
ncbi:MULTISPECIES: helix-turn-helix domain-containing protein [Corynebacterium]|uniref:helix-turn-helix domain-containing protein n=1 Tax=Corynebacterium TaxID=1716 RepID=UPI00341AD312